MTSPLRFDILATSTDTMGGRARLGRVTTPHGSFDTPAFMPVGTQATVKGLLPSIVESLGAQIILGNTYHLLLRPGSELVAKMGGLHKWMGWNRPILTDSGGFQVFSLADINRISDDGVIFKSHLDGRLIDLTPERSIRVQNELGADIIMAFDDCPPTAKQSKIEEMQSRVQSPESRVEDQDASDDAASSASASSTLDSRLWTLDSSRYAVAVERSMKWLERCIAAHARPHDQALFGIVQGGTDLELRSACVRRIVDFNLPGYAIGGVAVGETFNDMKRVVEHTAPLLPADRPRYLMGVGYERDILMAVQAGVDMFDCVLPTRNGRNANAFTPTGQIRLRNAKFADDPRPIDETCDCIACGGPQSLESRVQSPESGHASDGAAISASSSSTPDSGLWTLDSSSSPRRGFSRSYLRHLFMAEEMLGPILVSAHNIRHFQRYMLDIRRAIHDNDWSLIARRWPVAFDTGD